MRRQGGLADRSCVGREIGGGELRSEWLQRGGEAVNLRSERGAIPLEARLGTGLGRWAMAGLS